MKNPKCNCTDEYYHHQSCPAFMATLAFINQNDAKAPEILARCGTVHLHFGYDDDRETVEIEGSITASEICFLKEMLGSWIRQKLLEMGE